jgi:3'(2'), 5'-bisphosphate nucleotidase
VTNLPIQSLLEIAIRAALDAGKSILEIYNSADFGVEFKKDDSPLTKADSAAHEVIAAALASSGFPVISEEDVKNHSYQERSAWKSCWIVDPLDGTKEFIKRNGEFTVNIALCENGVPVLGVIYTPVQDLLHFSTAASDAFRVASAAGLNKDEIKSKAEKLPLQKLPPVFTIAGSRSHSSPETEAYVEEQRKKHGNVEFISAGSSLKFCLLAEGKAHVYPRFAPTMEWDTAAGQAILEAAGGTLEQWPSREPMRYNREELRNGWFLASLIG